MIAIRPAAQYDVETLADLLDELDQFYGASEVESRSRRIEGINAALFASPPTVFALLAWNQSRAVGLASYSFHWPAVGVSRSLYLKELFVSKASRRSGVGLLLMHEVFEIGLANNCSRIEWATEVGNTDAQSFYSAIGASIQDGKVSYRITP